MSNLFLTVLSLSLMGSIIIIVVVLLDKMFRVNYSRRWIYIIWVVLAVRMILPFHMSFIDLPERSHWKEVAAVSSTDTRNRRDISEWTSQFDPIALGDTTKGDDSQITEAETVTSTNSSNVITNSKSLKDTGASKLSFLLPIIDIMAVIWAVGVLLFLIYHFGAYLSYRKKISRWSIQADNNEAQVQHRSLCEKMNIKSQIEILTSNQVQAPMLMGLLKPYIVLPSRDFTAEQYYFILKHELIHYKRGDLFYKLIMLLTAALHWFNPLVHYMVYRANQDLELYCDEKLVAKEDVHYREKYSQILLQMITASAKSPNLLLSTGFSNPKSRLKNRFFQIMNSKPTKKGRGLVIVTLCLIAVFGNLIAWYIPTRASNAEIKDHGTNQSASSSETKDDINSGKLDEISNILVIGIDGVKEEKYLNADSVVLVSVNPDTKKISIVSFLRDMYLQIPGRDKGKLSSIYSQGGANLLKQTIETNFDLQIDHTVTVNMGAFENIINSIGGVEIELSDTEAQYLNSTNYISNQQYRSVKAGKQKLNGNQALGYVRIRKVPTIQGEREDLGRTVRLRTLLTSVIQECTKIDIMELTALIIKVLPNVNTDLTLRQTLVYVNTVLQGDLITTTNVIPAADSYTAKVLNNMSVIDIDLEKNTTVLKELQ